MTWIAISLALTAVLPLEPASPAFLDDPILCCATTIALTNNTETYTYVNGVPDQLEISLTFNVTVVGTSCDCYYEIEVFTCNDPTPVYISGNSYTTGGTKTPIHTIDIDCNNPPASYTVKTVWETRVQSKCEPDPQSLTEVFNVDPPQFCSGATVEELACYLPATPLSISADDLKLYKEVPMPWRLPGKEVPIPLWMLHVHDSSGAHFGEAVNGVFRAPGDGWVIVSEPVVTPERLPVIIHFADAPDGPGWQTPQSTSQPGSPLTGPRCFEMTTGQQIQFNIRTLRAANETQSGTISLQFDLLVWNSQTCSLDHYQGKLDRRVAPLQIVGDPLIPKIAKRQQLGKTPAPRPGDPPGDVDTLLQLPWCGVWYKGQPEIGNMSDWFVAWPTPAGFQIEEGFARRWWIDDTGVRSPGPASRRVQYSGNPNP